MALGSYMLSHSERLIVVSAIANIYARDATLSVMSHNTLNSLYDGRFILGLSVSYSPLVSTSPWSTTTTTGVGLASTKAILKMGAAIALWIPWVVSGTADQIKAKLPVHFYEGANQVVIQAVRADGLPGPRLGCTGCLGVRGLITSAIK
jgi:hypothetical protein